MEWRAIGIETAVTDWFRLFVDVLLYGGTRFVPRRPLLALASIAGVLDATFTLKGRSWRKELHSTHGLSGWKLFAQAVRAVSTEYRDLVRVTRIARGRDPWDSQIFHENGEDVLRVLSEGGSIIAVSCHFAYRSVSVPLLLSPGGAATVMREPHPSRPWMAWAYRDRLRVPKSLVVACDQISQQFFVSWDTGRDTASLKALVRHLRRPGSLAVMALDAPGAPWEAFVRPFAGSSRRAFPAGPVRLARTAKCHVVSFVVEDTGDDEFVIHWGEVICGAELESEETRSTALSKLVDELERGIGRFRTQYPMLTGTQRTWDRGSKRWLPEFSPHPEDWNAETPRVAQTVLS